MINNLLFYDKIKSSLAKKMLTLILFSSTIITFLIILTQLFFEYKTDVAHIKQRINQIETSYVKPLALSVWTYNIEQYKTQLEGILNIEDIVYAQILTSEKRDIYSKGLLPENKKITKNYPLKTNLFNKEIIAGELIVVASLQRVYDDLFNRALIILLTQGVKTFLISFIILYIFHLFITKHLYRISEFTKQINFYDDEKLILNKNNDNDEIDNIAFIINEMKEKEKKHKHELQKLNESLEEKVKLRTQEFEYEKNYAQKILDINPDIIIVTDGYKMISVNNSFFNFVEFDTLEEFQKYHECICEYFITFNEMEFPKDNMIEGLLWTEYIMQHNEKSHIVKLKKNNKIYYFDIYASKLDDVNSLVIFTDITIIKKQEAILKEQTYIDELTKLYNRKSYNDKIRELLEDFKRYGTVFSMIMVDIDKFKFINDTYGHKIGDEVLVAISSLTSNCVRKNDYVFRIGGEEFVILLKQTNKEQASILAEKIRQKVQSELDIIENKTITISLGVTQIQENDNEDIIFKRTDKALYEAKNSGRNKVNLI